MLPTYTHSFSVPLSASPIDRLSAEKELIDLLRSGQESAFCVLYDRYSAVLYAIILKIVKDRILAEDLLQEAFVKIWFHFATYDERKGRLFTWMLNIARNLSIDKTRSLSFKQRAITHSVEYAFGLSSTVSEWLGLEALLPRLKESERILIELIYYQGYSIPEVAKQLDIPLGTVKTRLRAAVCKLRKYV